jgi:PBSX family phage terminase large subunit
VANNQNLKPVRTKKEARELGRKGGIASGEARREKATMLSVLEKMLDEKPIKDNEQGLTYRELATLGLIKGANKGNAENYKLIQSLMEKKEAKDSERDINIVIPARDLASSFVDINRSIDEREYREYYLEGGRGSTKSSFISEKIIELLQNNPRMCAIALRKVKDTLKDSVYAQLEWAINQLSETYPFIKEEWKLTKSPLEMTNTRTGQVIYFRGADDYGKIKSLKTPQDKYMGIEWFEEFDQFNGMNEVRKINQSLIRGGEDFIQFYSYNTPASSQHFVNIEKIIPKTSRIVHLSDYRNVPIKWLGQPFIDEANFLKEINERLYNNEYLGLATGVGGNVFENVELRKITDEEINNFDYNYYGLDFGWIDPVAFNGMYYNSNRRELYIYEELHGSKISNEKLGEMLEPWKEQVITCDSAEPKSIGDLKSYGYIARGAIKGPGSIEYSMKWLASLSKIIIDQERCPYTATEFLNYEFEQDKDGNYITSYPDGNDHHISAVRYGMEQVWKKKGQ